MSRALFRTRTGLLAVAAAAASAVSSSARL